MERSYPFGSDSVAQEVHRRLHKCTLGRVDAEAGCLKSGENLLEMLEVF